VQLPRLTAILGGYDGARVIHLGVLVALALFTVVHVIQVLLQLGHKMVKYSPR
jgi:thiosulfate reductase cytochrome b subunit